MDNFDDFVNNLQAEIFEEAKSAYGEKGFQRWRNPRFNGRMEHPDAYARITGKCGDTIEIYLQLKNDRVSRASYFTDGCASSCLTSMLNAKEGFEGYAACSPAGVFTCRCPGDNAVNLAKILKSKGAEAIHFCTCAFARKTDAGWQNGDGFCDHLEAIMERIHAETGLPCIKGTAHLPKNYTPEKIGNR